MPREGVTYVPNADKERLWAELMKNFTLPAEEDEDDPVIENRCKAWALMEMGELFRSWKKRLNKLVTEGTTPEFVGIYENIKHEWDDFKAYKLSTEAKKRSEINKKNAAKKKYHHVMGSGGYRTAKAKWEKMEDELAAKNIEFETLYWPERLRDWFYGIGGKLDTETGECIFNEDHGVDPVKKIRDVLKEVEEGKFQPNRENDELSRALGNAEHSGRTRGTAGSVPWKIGFPLDVGTYRSRARKKNIANDRMQKLEDKLAEHEKEIAELKAERRRPRNSCESETHADPSPGPKSMQRSSVASTELVRPGSPSGTCHPVDCISQQELCELHVPCLNITVKVADGFAVPHKPDGTYHCRPIPDGYVVVAVDEVMKGYEGIKLDYPTGEDEIELRYACKTTCLWKKEYIVFPHLLQKQTCTRSKPPPSPHASPDLPDNDNNDQGASPSPSPWPRQPTPPPRQPTPPPQNKRKSTAASTSTLQSGSGKKARKMTPPPPPPPPTTKLSLKRKKSPPKPVYSPEAIQWAYEFLTQPSQYQMNMNDDYVRVLVRNARRVREERRRAAGATQKRDVSQLGMQAGQSVAPLRVYASGAQTEIGKQAQEIGISVSALRTLQSGGTIGFGELARQYVRGQPLIDSSHLRLLPARMHQLHDWYMSYTANNDGDYIYAKIQKSHYGPGDDELHIELPELFQLFNFDALDKSIVSAYCL